MKRFPIISKAYFWLMIWWALVLWSWVVFFLNYKPSIEFTWGVEVQIQPVTESQTLRNDVDAALDEAWFTSAEVSVNTNDEASTLLVANSMKNDSEAKTLQDLVVSTLIENKYIATTDDVLSLSVNWASVSEYAKSRAIWSLVVWVLLVMIYMFLSFGSIRKIIPPQILATVTIWTMFFDISMTAWAYGLLMMIDPTLQVDTIFILALLTIMWYSINDTIIVLDRIRENAKADEKALEAWSIKFGAIIEESVRQTMRRSIWTSLSTFLVVLAMFIFGSNDIRYFAYTMWAWILVWTFSSIFMAAPAIYLLLSTKLFGTQATLTTTKKSTNQKAKKAISKK